MGRAEYGGFLMSLPPRRLYDVWQDADYQFAESKSERLLLAALDYAIHRHVVYVAAKPPRSIFKTIASRAGRTIVYIPIGQLSPASLKKIRVVHVLDGYDKREIAKDYL
jgi:Mor family transcriptional regulator